MPTRVVLGPVTRIEGHLDIEVTIEADGGVQRVVDARCAGTMFRGIEMILLGRHPRDAVQMTARVCGVCPTSHALAAALALESAYGPLADPPSNGRLLRNLLLGVDFLQSHILHFYQLTLLDYVDASVMPGKLPWLSREAVPDLIAGPGAQQLLEHYFEALGIRRAIGQMAAIFGGRAPCSGAIVPGGCASTLNDRLDAPLKDEPKASDRISLFRELLNRVRDFIANAYLPDVQVLANRFPAYARIGRGPGNLLAFGGFDDPHPDRTPLFRRGTYVDGAIGALDPQDIAESLVSSRYIREGSAPQPTQSVTTPDIDKLNAYTWIKAPRYQSRVFEVGPLARMWIAGHYREGISAMDRIRARAVEAQRLADAMVQWLDDLQIEEATRSRIRYSRSGTGTGMIEAPRGALGHWMAFRQNGITRYQIITPTAWNASPKDESGQPGPMEQAIIGTPVRDRSRPIEVLRVVHSFDPCLACAVH